MFFKFFNDKIMNDSSLIAMRLLEKKLRINKKFLRPSKNTTLIGDTSKARKKFNFKIETNLEKIIAIMMENDLKIEINKK